MVIALDAGARKRGRELKRRSREEARQPGEMAQNGREEHSCNGKCSGKGEQSDLKVGWGTKGS